MNKSTHHADGLQVQERLDGFVLRWTARPPGIGAGWFEVHRNLALFGHRPADSLLALPVAAASFLGMLSLCVEGGLWGLLGFSGGAAVLAVVVYAVTFAAYLWSRRLRRRRVEITVAGTLLSVRQTSDADTIPDQRLRVGDIREVMVGWSVVTLLTDSGRIELPCHRMSNKDEAQLAALIRGALIPRTREKAPPDLQALMGAVKD